MKHIYFELLHEDLAFSQAVRECEQVHYKLSPKQNMIINCLQNGWGFVTTSESNVITCCSDIGQFEFKSGLFYRLVRMGLIYQRYDGWHRHEWILTELGRKIQTKDVQKVIINQLSQVYKKK
jgi:hypothetical protein